MSYGSPSSSLLCGSPTPWPRRRRLRFLSPPSTTGTDVCSSPPSGTPVEAPSALELRRRVSPSPAMSVEGAGPLGFPGRPASFAPRADTPPDARPPCPSVAAATLLPSGNRTPWASGMRGFEADGSLARMLTYLRINRPVAGTAARLVTGLPGSALAGWDLHPLNDCSDFQKASPSLLPVRPGFPDRCPIYPVVEYAARMFRFRHITSAIRIEDTNGATSSQRTLYVPDIHTARAKSA